MIKAPIPANEQDRLAALQRYLILDTLPEKAFDEIVWLVSYVCQTPIAYVSIIDKDRQWFKSKIGLSAAETEREVAFCAHAILGQQTMVVPDTLDDIRFVDNPLVLGDPHIRFYAGSPIMSEDGFPLGTLCAVDHQPRNLTPHQLEALGMLARQTEKLLEYRRTSHEIKEALNEINILNGLLPICAWCKRIRDEDGDWHILETYVQDHSEASFTHGICPECIEKRHTKRS
jgi:GAF domain-containing protein